MAQEPHEGLFGVHLYWQTIQSQGNTSNRFRYTFAINYLRNDSDFFHIAIPLEPLESDEGATLCSNSGD